MDTPESLHTLDGVVTAAERFDSELTRIRVEIERLLRRAKQGDDISGDFRSLSARASQVTAAASRTASLAKSYFDQTRSAS
jgi:hypothetical protein